MMLCLAYPLSFQPCFAETGVTGASKSWRSRKLIEFATRELQTAHDQLMLLGNGSAEEKMAAFLANWRNRLARVTAVPQPVPLPMRLRISLTFLASSWR